MKRRDITIVDYGVGNFSSVQGAVRRIGHRCRVTDDEAVLASSDLIILPGVGAFPTAMERLKATALDRFVTDQANSGQPIVGLCLGMQLLVDQSAEHGRTAGLGLIPGEVTPLDDAPWHIGWNMIENVSGDPMLSKSDGQAVYFNHSYVVNTASDYRLCATRLRSPFASGIRRKNVVGFQFHPEKSQAAGRELLQSVIEGLCGA